MKTTRTILKLMAVGALTAICSFVGSAKAAFTPPHIPGCTLWLDGSDVNGDGIADTYTDGLSIGTWVDKSGKGNDFSNSDSATQPVFKVGLVNGKNGLYFNGTSSYLQKTGGVLTEGDDNYEYVVVWRPHKNSGLQRVFEQSDQAGGGGRNAALLAINAAYGFNGEGNDRHDLAPFDANQWILTDMKVDNVLNPGNVNIKHNGANYSGTTGNPAGVNVGAAGCQLGRKYINGEFLDGDIVELIVYTNTLNEVERNVVGYYLQQKYGFSLGYTASASFPSGTVAFYTFNGSGNDDSGQGNTLAAISGTAQYPGGGKFDGALYTDGGTVLSTLSGTFPPGVPTGSSAFTVAAFLKPSSSAGWAGYIGWGTSDYNNVNNFRLTDTGAINHWFWNNDYTASAGSINLKDGSWHSVVLTYGGPQTDLIVYLDGAEIGRQIRPDPPHVAATNFYVGANRYLFPLQPFLGSLDELLIANRAFSSAEVSAYNTKGGANMMSALFFTQEPESVGFWPGETYILAGQAIGGEPISYQWYKNGAPVGGATSTNLVLSNMQTSHVGTYFLVASNASVMVTSRVAQVAAMMKPSDIPSCAVWLDGSDVDGDGNADAYTDGQVIGTWVDKSGRGNNFTGPAGPTFKVNLINGRNGLYFNGSQYLQKTGGVLPEGDDHYEFVVVWHPHISSSGQRVFEQSSQDGAANRMAALLAWDTSYGFNGQNNDYHWRVPFAANQWILTDLKMDNALPVNMSIKHNGTTYDGTTTGGGPAALDVGAAGCQIGRKYYGAEFLNGDIMELIIYTNALTDVQRNKVGYYLQQKYGLAFSYCGPEAYLLPAGTVAYYPFDVSGNDDSGHGNSLQGATGTPQYTSGGRLNGALYVDGSTTLGTVSGLFPTNIPTGANPYTVACFIKADTDCHVRGGWIGYGTASTPNLANNFRMDGTYSGVWNYWHSSDLGASLPSGTFQDGWHSVVGTWDGTTEKIYIDGVQRASRNPASPNIGATEFVVGRTLNDANFKGWIDELLIANRAFSASEVAAYHLDGGPIVLIFQQEPQTFMASAGETRSLVGQAIGVEPISYQWYKDGALLTGATGTNLDFPSLQSSNAGSYFLVASNASKTITSAVARVAVRLPADGGLLARWSFDDGTARDVYGIMDGTLQGGATISDGKLQLNGTDAYVQTLAIPLNVTNKTLVAWVSLANLTQQGGGVITLERGDGVVFDSVTYAEREQYKWMAASDGWSRSQEPPTDKPLETVAPGEMVMMAIVYKSDNSVSIYRNGQAYGTPYTRNPLVTYQAGNGRVVLGVRHSPPIVSKMFAGQIDEARLYDRALTIEELAVMAGSRLYIASHPQSQYAFVGDTVTLTVSAGGDAPLGYQWLKNNAVMDGQTATNLVLSNAQQSDSGGYSVVVTNAFGSITSSVATLIVYHPVANNLIGHWKLDEIAGLTATNATGNDLTGTLLNYVDTYDSQWQFGQIEGALAFDTDKRVVISDCPLLRPDSFSVSFWVQVDAALEINSSMISKENAAICESWGLELRPSGQMNFFLFNYAGFLGAVQSSVNLDVGPLHHVVLTYNHLTSTADIFVDGLPASGTRDTGTASGAVGYDNSPLTFGRRLGACPYPTSFTGLLDDVQLYSKALTAGEVAYLYSDPGFPAVPLQVSGQVALQGYTGTARDGAGTCTVTFKATQTLGGATNLLATWNEPLTFAAGGDSYGVASFTLTNVPAGTTHLSAKSPWNLRKRLPVPFLAGASTASFTGDSLLPGGDINGSDLVDIEDYFQLAASWYQADASSDIDGSGLVDIDDYFILSDHWYQASEPE